MKVILAILTLILLFANVFIPLLIFFYALVHQVSNLIITCIIFIITIVSFVMISSLFLFSYTHDYYRN
jgi:hypothetical protein